MAQSVAKWTHRTVHAGVGYAAVINAAFIAIFYIVILAWCLFYFFASLTAGNTILFRVLTDNWKCVCFTLDSGAMGQLR